MNEAQDLAAQLAVMRRALAGHHSGIHPDHLWMQASKCDACRILSTSDTIGADVWAVVEAAEKVWAEHREMIERWSLGSHSQCPTELIAVALDRLREKGLLGTASTDSPTEVQEKGPNS